MSGADVAFGGAPGALPLLVHASLDATFAHRQGQAVTVRTFLQDVVRVAAALPDRRHVLNACADRYHFAVGLAAAMTRGQISLLPPSYNQEMVRQVCDIHPDVYGLSEQSLPDLDMPQTLYPPRPHGSEGASDPDEAQTIPAIDANQVIACVFTSGSTGRPTEHVKRWGSLVRNVRMEAQRLGLSVDSGHSLVGTVPPQHMYGLESTVLLAWQSGAAMVAERPFYPADISAVLAGLPSPKVLVTTPFHLRTWLAESADLPGVDLMVSATAPLASRLAREAEHRCGAPLIEVYGSTETGQLATRRSAESAQWLSFNGLQLTERDGRVWFSGGHLEAPIALSDVLELCDAAQARPHVGGADNAPGTNFILHGRSADMVNVAGKRTSLAYLNLQLGAIPGVLDGAFFWPESDDAGHGDGVVRLMAFVVAPGLDLAQLQAALRQRIDPAFMPRPLHLVDALPRNATGKLPHAALLDLARRTAQATHASASSV
ncbi:MAG: acyl-CoA synthetase [Burkholderiales bacterium]|nr:acyl-CoA synthetase [Burkholderiales bacterium]